MNKKIKIEFAILVIAVVSLIIGSFIWLGNKKEPDQKMVSDVITPEVKKESAEDQKFFEELEASEVVTGYVWNSEKGSPNFSSVAIPVFGLESLLSGEKSKETFDNVLEKEYSIEIWDGQNFIFYQKAPAGKEVSFPDGGVYRFRVTGIDEKQKICADEKNVWGIKFATAGTFKGDRTGITVPMKEKNSCQKNQLIAKVQCDSGDVLRLYRTKEAVSFSDSSGKNIAIKPVLFLNTKIFSEPTERYLDSLRVAGFYPFLPEYTKNLNYKTYTPPSYTNFASEPPMTQDDINKRVHKSVYWNVYVDPEKFTPEEFNTITSCYEKNKSSIDAAVRDSKDLASYDKNNLSISSIVYSKELTPYTFSCPENVKLQVMPDANWSVTYKSIPKGKEFIIPREGTVVFNPSNPDDKQDFLMMKQSTSNPEGPDLIKACTRDSDGKRLEDIYNVKVPKVFFVEQMELLEKVPSDKKIDAFLQYNDAFIRFAESTLPRDNQESQSYGNIAFRICAAKKFTELTSDTKSNEIIKFMCNSTKDIKQNFTLPMWQQYKNLVQLAKSS